MKSTSSLGRQNRRFCFGTKWFPPLRSAEWTDPQVVDQSDALFWWQPASSGSSLVLYFRLRQKTRDWSELCAHKSPLQVEMAQENLSVVLHAQGDLRLVGDQQLYYLYV